MLHGDACAGVVGVGKIYFTQISKIKFQFKFVFYSGYMERKNNHIPTFLIFKIRDRRHYEQYNDI